MLGSHFDVLQLARFHRLREDSLHLLAFAESGHSHSLFDSLAEAERVSMVRWGVGGEIAIA